MKYYDVHFVIEHHGYMSFEAETPEDAAAQLRDTPLELRARFVQPERTRVTEVVGVVGGEIHGTGLDTSDMTWEEE